MIREYMSQIDMAVSMSYGVLLLFLTFFVVVSWRAWRIDNQQLEEFESMPLDIPLERRL